MTTKEILSKELKSITLEIDLKKIKKMYNTQKVTHIPVVQEGYLSGNLAEEAVKYLSEEKGLEELKPTLQQFKLYDFSTIFETFKVFSDNNSNVIPIVNQKEKYIGNVMMDDVVEYCSKFPFFKDFGAILIVESTFNNYSLSKISQIVEAQNSRFYGAFVTSFSNETVHLVIKISAENVASISETLERFGYNILNKFYKDSKKVLMDERFDQLMKYINV